MRSATMRVRRVDGSVFVVIRLMPPVNHVVHRAKYGRVVLVLGIERAAITVVNC